MRIGIDIDGVLTDFEKWQLDYGSKYFLKYNKNIVNPSGYDSDTVFNVTNEMDSEFWKEYLYDYAVNEPARKFSGEVIDKLKEKGFEIYIITARRNGDEWFPDDLKNDVEKITKNWLKENKIYYDEIVFDVKDKGKYCKDNNINIMIEDDPINLRKLLSNTNILVFDYPYNRNKEFSNLTRVYSWYDTYYRIKCIKE